MNSIKMSSRFICSVAMPLALMFAACSDGDKPTAGGSAEETGVYAGLENIVIAGRAQNLAVSAQVKVSGENSQIEAYAGTAYAEGALVNFFGVDSATFEISREPFAQTTSGLNGDFEIDSISVESPYAVVEVSGKIVLDAENPYRTTIEKKVDSLMHASAGLTHDVTQTTYRTVIDLRDTGDVKVNILTTLATPRTLNLAESGVPFAQAKEQAESDVLHSLGIYEAVAPFDSVDFSQKSNSVFPVFVMVSYLFGGSPKAVEVAADAIGKHGTWGEVVSLENVVTRTLERDFRLLRESEFLGKLGIGPDDMQIAEQVEKYYFNAIAINAFQKDRCTADNQGEEVAYGEAHNLVCEPDYWVLHVKEFSKTLGTVTDARDGKAYKTFSFEYEGKTRTWLAENLNYEAPYSWCYGDSSADCEKYGREYAVATMFGIQRDSAYLHARGVMDSLSGVRDSVRAVYRDAVAAGTMDEEAFDAAMDPYWDAFNEASAIFDSVFDASVGRDVCMDGWHVATSDDWANLYNFLYDKGIPVAEGLKSTSWTKGKDGLDVVGFNMLLPESRDITGYIILGKNGETNFITKGYSFMSSRRVASIDFSTNRRSLSVNEESLDCGAPVRCVKD